MMNRRKPHYKRKYERLPKITKCLRVNSIPVRVNNSYLAESLVERPRGFYFYIILPYGSYMGLIFTSSILWLFEVLCGFLGLRAVAGLVACVALGFFIEIKSVYNSVTRLCLKLLEHMAVN